MERRKEKKGQKERKQIQANFYGGDYFFIGNSMHANVSAHYVALLYNNVVKQNVEMNSEWTDNAKWGIDGQQILDYQARAMLGIVGRDSGVYCAYIGGTGASPYRMTPKRKEMNHIKLGRKGQAEEEGV